MFVQTLNTPNPNSLKFLPGEKVSLSGPMEFNDKKDTDNDLVRNILSINGVTGIFLSDDFLSVNKEQDKDWEDIKHIVISLINEFYAEGNKFVFENGLIFDTIKEIISSEKILIKDQNLNIYSFENSKLNL